jgi:predicted dinucleotide-utilizing enzyme
MTSPDAPIYIQKPVPTDRRIRFALVGCGRIAANHFEALEKHKERAELVAVCDIDAKALEAAHRRTGAPAYRSLDDLLAKANADIGSSPRRAASTRRRRSASPSRAGT